MRASSVRQPGAELIASESTDTERRTWQQDFRADLLLVAMPSPGLDPNVPGGAEALVRAGGAALVAE